MTLIEWIQRSQTEHRTQASIRRNRGRAESARRRSVPWRVARPLRIKAVPSSALPKGLAWEKKYLEAFGSALVDLVAW